MKQDAWQALVVQETRESEDHLVRQAILACLATYHLRVLQRRGTVDTLVGAVGGVILRSEEGKVRPVGRKLTPAKEYLKKARGRRVYGWPGRPRMGR